MLLLGKHQTFKYIQETKKSKICNTILAIKKYEKDMERSGVGF